MSLKIKMVVHSKTEYTDSLDVDRKELGTVEVARLTLLSHRPEKAQKHDPERFVITGECNLTGPAEEFAGLKEGATITLTLGAR